MLDHMRQRLPLLVLCGLVLACPARAAAQAELPAADRDKFAEFLDHTVRSPLFYLQVGGSGLLDEMGGFPDEWSGSSGFGRRNAARLEQLFAAGAIGHGVAAALGHQVTYDLCSCRGALPRTWHAVARVFTSVRDDGRVTANVSRLVAAYSSSAIADFWYPASYTRSDIFWQATTSLGTAAGLNALREFIFH
jgi:hypothetical protein